MDHLLWCLQLLIFLILGCFFHFLLFKHEWPPFPTITFTQAELFEDCMIHVWAKHRIIFHLSIPSTLYPFHIKRKKNISEYFIGWCRSDLDLFVEFILPIQISLICILTFISDVSIRLISPTNPNLSFIF